MSKGPILTNFVSEMDKFLEEFDAKHPEKNKYQLKEIQKYQRIYKLRDDPVSGPASGPMLWEDF